jgi:sirohydrochlorin ferrochelatase
MVEVLVDFLTLQQDQLSMVVQAVVAQGATQPKQIQAAQHLLDKGLTAVQVFLVLVMLSQAQAVVEKMP